MGYPKEKPTRDLEDLVEMVPFYVLVGFLIVVFCAMYLFK